MLPNQSRVTPAVKWLMIATGAFYVLEILPWTGGIVYEMLGLSPARVFAHGELWRLVGYLFLHDPSSPWHLLFNMFALWMFGCELEQRWGTQRFAIFYFLGGIGSGLFSVIMWNSYIIGASGAIMALLTAYAWYFPDRQLLMFFIIPMPVRWAVAVMGFIAIFGSMSHGSSIAHLTHLGGIAVAAIYLWLEPRITQWKTRNELQSAEQTRRVRAQEFLKKEQFFGDVVDPILKKISQQGMESLTKEERKALDRAAQWDKERIKKAQVIPFDLFRK